MNKTVAKESDKILLSAADCAKMCGISRRTWFRLAASAKCPASVRVGASPRWRSNDIDQWISMGCPDRKTFESLQEVSR